MSKAIHWQLPFSSIAGTQYRIDIYADGACTTPTQLVGAASPFTTEKDGSDDIYEHVRSSTAKMTIVNTTGIATISELIPATNTEHPLQLIRVSDSKVMWQGFMSVQMYSQAYISRAEEITFECRSVLAAMDNEQVSNAIVTAYKTVEEVEHIHAPLRWVLQYVVRHFFEDAGIGNWLDRVSYPERARDIFNQRIDTSLLFSMNEFNNVDNAGIEVIGKSVLYIISTIASYMGWVAQEDGNVLRFVAVNFDSPVYEEPISALETGIHTAGSIVPAVSVNMADLEYRGTGHMLTIDDKRSAVQVECVIEDYKNELKQPECPVGISGTREFKTAIKSDYLFYTYRKDYYNHVTINHQAARLQVDEDYYTMTCATIAQTTPAQVASHSSSHNSHNFPAENFRTSRDETFYFGCFLAKIDEDGGASGGTGQHDYSDGLYMCLAPHLYDPNDASLMASINTMRPAFSIRSMQNVSLVQDSYLVVNMKTLRYGTIGSAEGTETHMVMTLRVGDKYYDYATKTWKTSKSYFTPRMWSEGKIEPTWTSAMPFDEQDGYIIHLTEELMGEMELAIYPTTWKDSSGDERHRDYWYELGILDLSVEQIFRKDRVLTTGNYIYRKTLGGKQEEYQRQVYIATDRNTINSPSILKERFQYIYAEESIKYYDAAGNEYTKRPEYDLIERLATQYGQPRRRIELEVGFIDKLPLTKVTGYDEKTYLPLSESRDWRTDTSKVTCFETAE